MNWLEISVPATHAATEAVADIFMGLGAGGVVIDDPRELNFHIQAGLWDCTDLTAVKDEGWSLLKAYLPRDERLPGKLSALEDALSVLNSRLGITAAAPAVTLPVEEQDWAHAWKQYFHTARLGRNIVIKPSWEDYQALPGDLIIELDPGMAFGTGTHHTTALCLEQLEKLLRPGQILFDLGTGSGVLAMAAARLGALVTAVEIDPVAVRVAKENALLNGLSDKINVREGNLLAGLAGRADIIVANIVADVIIRLLPDIPQSLKPGGLFLASGIIDERQEEVEERAASAGLKILESAGRGGWVAITAQKI